MTKNGRLIIVSGPSGVGKTTLLKRLLEEYKEKIEFSVSYTSRKPRINEKGGIDYFFVSKEDFELDIKENMFLEYAVVHGNYYGTSKRYIEGILRKGKSCLLDIDVQGALTLMKKNIEAVYVFIAPPSVDVLKERLLTRSTDPIEEIEKRIKNAEKELAEKDKYDYIVINDELEMAYRELAQIILG